MLRATTTSSGTASRQAAAAKQQSLRPATTTPTPPPSASSPLAALALAGLMATCPPPASASPLADFWRSRQSANGGIKLLAPLRTSQMRLEEATRILAAPPPSSSASAVPLEANASTTAAAAAQQSDTPTSEDLSRALSIVRASSLNCYAYDGSAATTIEERASLFQQTYLGGGSNGGRGGGTDPCTWRIIIRNVTTLEPPAKRQEGLGMAEELVRSYQLLDALVGEAADGRPGALDRARGQADVTLRLEREIEAFVRGVLKV